MKNITKKNLLDLHHQKYLMTASTSAVIGFTYLVGVGVAIITHQINFKDIFSWFLLLFFSTFFLGLIAIVFFKAVYHMRNILREVKELYPIEDI